jgi:hypothetical protein
MQCASTVLYCHLRPVWLYITFPHYLINGTIFERKNIHTYIYSGPSKVERNPFQEAVRLSICSTFELKWHEPHDAVQCCAHGSTFEFLFEFQTEFFSNFFFEFQVVRESNRSTFAGPLYNAEHKTYVFIFSTTFV